MARITEKELILPTLYLLDNEENKTLTTSQLIKKLEELMDIDEQDNRIIKGRKDTYFTQKVRNLKSHNTLEKKEFAIYNNGKFQITPKGEAYLKNNLKQLELIIIQEKFLELSSNIVTGYYNEFRKSISNIQKLTNIEDIPENLQRHYFNMLFSSIITSLETYLSDALKFNLKENEKSLIKFVETFKDFKNIKCDFNNIFNLYDSIEEKVQDGLSGLLYHNLPKIKGIYKNTFGIDFQPISNLMKNIEIRHDLIHRNGKKRSGTYHDITKDKVLELCDNILIFVEDIENQFKNTE